MRKENRENIKSTSFILDSRHCFLIFTLYSLMSLYTCILYIYLMVNKYV